MSTKKRLIEPGMIGNEYKGGPGTEKRKEELIDYYRRIEKRAYEIYRDRLSQDRGGSPDADWAQAEAEVRKQPGR